MAAAAVAASMLSLALSGHINKHRTPGQVASWLLNLPPPSSLRQHVQEQAGWSQDRRAHALQLAVQSMLAGTTVTGMRELKLNYEQYCLFMLNILQCDADGADTPPAEQRQLARKQRQTTLKRAVAKELAANQRASTKRPAAAKKPVIKQQPMKKKAVKNAAKKGKSMMEQSATKAGQTVAMKKQVT